MRKLLATFTLFSLTLWAAGFWDKKKYTEWSEKDVDKIMKDSPWSHSVEIPMGGGRGGGGGGGRGGGGGGDFSGGGGGGGLGGGGGEEGGGGGGGGSRGGGGGGGGKKGGGGGGGGGGGTPMMSLTVRWQSALPVKQALVRLKLGPEGAATPETEKLLAPDTENYVVSFGSMPLTMIRGDATAIKSGASLSVKGKEPILPGEVKGDRQGNSGTLYFYFPRTTAITVEDNEVEFAFKFNTLNVKKKFKLKDMVVNGKLEI